MDALTFGVALLLCALEATLAGLACRRATVAAELVCQIETNREQKPRAISLFPVFLLLSLSFLLFCLLQLLPLPRLR
jgi:hypothetical protein